MPGYCYNFPSQPSRLTENWRSSMTPQQTLQPCAAAGLQQSYNLDEFVRLCASLSSCPDQVGQRSQTIPQSGPAPRSLIGHLTIVLDKIAGAVWFKNKQAIPTLLRACEDHFLTYYHICSFVVWDDTTLVVRGADQAAKLEVEADVTKMLTTPVKTVSVKSCPVVMSVLMDLKMEFIESTHCVFLVDWNACSVHCYGLNGAEAEKYIKGVIIDVECGINDYKGLCLLNRSYPRRVSDHLQWQALWAFQ
jgi:hypothetical protein